MISLKNMSLLHSWKTQVWELRVTASFFSTRKPESFKLETLNPKTQRNKNPRKHIKPKTPELRSPNLKSYKNNSNFVGFDVSTAGFDGGHVLWLDHSSV